MAGSQDPNENPVAINVVPMVDVIFCLCVFFMCSFKFKQIEGKFDSWLPKDKGESTQASDKLLDEIRVAMFWDEQLQATKRQLGVRIIKNDDELQSLIRGAHADYVRAGNSEVPVTIDADARVPWKDVINVMNLCKREKIDKIEFAFGAAPPSK
jgi:biopolymer transport protein ExbD